MTCTKNDFLSKEMQDLQEEIIGEILSNPDFKEKYKERLQRILQDVPLYDEREDCGTGIDPDQVRVKTLEVEKEYYYYEPHFFPLPQVGIDKCYLGATPGLIVAHAQRWKHRGFTLGGLIFSITLLPGEELELEYKTFDSMKTSTLTEMENMQKNSRNIEDRTSDSWEIVDSTQTRTNNELYGELNAELSAELEGKLDPMAALALGLGGTIAAGGTLLGLAVGGAGVAATLPTSGISLPTGLTAGGLITAGATMIGTTVGALGGIASLASDSGDKNFLKGKANGAVSAKGTALHQHEINELDKSTHKTLHEHTEKAATEVSKRNAVKIDIAKEHREESAKIRKISNINQCHAVSFHHFQLKKVFDVSTSVETVQLALFGKKIDAAKIIEDIFVEQTTSQDDVSEQPSSEAEEQILALREEIAEAFTEAAENAAQDTCEVVITSLQTELEDVIDQFPPEEIGLTLEQQEAMKLAFRESFREALTEPIPPCEEIIQVLESDTTAILDSFFGESSELITYFERIRAERDIIYRNRRQAWLAELEKYFRPGLGNARYFRENLFRQKFPREFGNILAEHIDRCEDELEIDYPPAQIEDWKEAANSGEKVLPAYFVSSAADILAARDADDQVARLILEIIQKAKVVQENAEQERIKQMVEELTQKLNKLQSEIKKDIMNRLMIREFEYGGICWEEEYALYFSPDVETSMNLLRPVWVCNFSLSRDDVEQTFDFGESSTFQAFKFLLDKMEESNGFEATDQADNFIQLINTLLTGDAQQKTQSVNTNGVYVEAMKSRCTACEPYYEEMRELEVQAKLAEIEEKNLKNQQLRLINKLIREEKPIPTINGNPENVTVTTNVNVDEES